MIATGESVTPTVPDGFAGRLRQVLDSYGSTSSLARAIDRSEGAVRKWLRGQSEPNVSDLRAICKETHTDVEWLVMGPPIPPAEGEPGFGVEEQRKAYGAAPELPALNYKLMDDVVRCIREESPVLLGSEVVAEKQSSVLTTVYNMSRRSRMVDSEEVSRVVGLIG